MLENPDFAIVDHIICILLNVASRRFEDHLLCSACHRKNHLHNRRFCRAYWRLKSPNCSHHLSQYLMHFKSRRGLLNQGKSILSAHFFNDGTKYVNYPLGNNSDLFDLISRPPMFSIPVFYQGKALGAFI